MRHGADGPTATCLLCPFFLVPLPAAFFSAPKLLFWCKPRPAEMGMDCADEPTWLWGMACEWLHAFGSVGDRVLG